jgi:hypothetical protein
VGKERSVEKDCERERRTLVRNLVAVSVQTGEEEAAGSEQISL